VSESEEERKSFSNITGLVLSVAHQKKPERVLGTWLGNGQHVPKMEKKHGVRSRRFPPAFGGCLPFVVASGIENV